MERKFRDPKTANFVDAARMMHMNSLASADVHGTRIRCWTERLLGRNAPVFTPRASPKVVRRIISFDGVCISETLSHVHELRIRCIYKTLLKLEIIE